MIKIKDLIINENEIIYIEEFDAQSLGIMFKGKDKAIFVDAHPEDIEWNYDSQERQYNEETEQLISSLQNKNYKLQHRIEELEEENKKLKELCDEYEEEHNNEFQCWKKDRKELLDKRQIIEKAIKKLENMKNIKGGINSTLLQAINEVDNTLKILKGEE